MTKATQPNGLVGYFADLELRWCLLLLLLFFELLSFFALLERVPFLNKAHFTPVVDPWEGEGAAFERLGSITIVASKIESKKRIKI